MASSLALVSCHTRNEASDPDDVRPRILGIQIKQGESILEEPYVLHRDLPEDITIEVTVYDPQATEEDPMGSLQLLADGGVEGAFEDPDFGNPEYQERVEDFIGEFPGWEHTIGPLQRQLTRDDFLPEEVFYGLGFEGRFTDSGPGMENLPDREGGDGIWTIRKQTRLDPRTKTHETRSWCWYFWATDLEGHTAEPVRIEVTVVN